ncbi:MAG: hypothetical protein ACI9J2_002616 [Saprospiraceae bacterium]|jgi:hypothetical protein
MLSSLSLQTENALTFPSFNYERKALTLPL